MSLDDYISQLLFSGRTEAAENLASRIAELYREDASGEGPTVRAGIDDGKCECKCGCQADVVNEFHHGYGSATICEACIYCWPACHCCGIGGLDEIVQEIVDT